MWTLEPINNEILYTAILNKQKCHFFYKNGEEQSKTSPVWGLVSFGGEYKERVKEGKDGRNIMYTYMKMKNETY
jgi:hypothetical protein